MKYESLIVGRDRAHVRSLLEQYSQHQVISASAFFDLVRLLPFLYDEKLQRDDHAPQVFALNILSRSKEFPLHWAHRFATLYSSLYHGTATPTQVYETIKKSHFTAKSILAVTADIEAKMKECSLVNSTSALHAAWCLIKNQSVVPLALINAHIKLCYLVDLTALEIEVIKALAHHGLTFEVIFPLDFAKRSINVAVDFAARQFEMTADALHIDLHFDNLAKEGPLKPLIDALLVDNNKISIKEEHCTISSWGSLDEEARAIAVAIARLKTQKADCTIAVALRTLDKRSRLLKHALIAHGIEVRDRKGEPLSNTAAGLLLETMLKARQNGLARRELIALINHPLFVPAKTLSTTAFFWGELFATLGIDDALLLPGNERCRYEEVVTSFRDSMAAHAHKRLEIESFFELIKGIKEVLSCIELTDTWPGFLRGVQRLITMAVEKDDRSAQALLEFVNNLLLSSARESSDEIELCDSSALLLLELRKHTLSPVDYRDQGAVELVLLPELLGRSFEHVFIPDISFGRLPQSLSMDPLLSDEQRLQLNKAMAYPVLRVLLDDPFEPLIVPPRQALEPFWFASAIAAAERSVHFSYAEHDYEGAEQAPSEFFIWLSDHVSIDKSPQQVRQNFVSKERWRFLAGTSERAKQSTQGLDFNTALRHRTTAFCEQSSDTFAFSMSKADVLASFAGRLGPKPSRPLTPTMVEAFASCRFSGWLNRIVGVKNPEQEHGDLDARILGHLAHKTLEQFFKSYKNEPKERRHYRVKNLLKEAGEIYLKTNFIPQVDLFYSYIEWLNGALVALIDALIEQGYAKPTAQEEPFGLMGAKRPGLRVACGQQAYLLGGVIDRIDTSANALMVMDYKLSRIDNLRVQSSKAAVLVTNFQVPIYMRLAALAFGIHDPRRIDFAYASIRDADVLALSFEQHEDFYERVFDDAHPQSLAKTINNIFGPISGGSMIATVGEHCTMCSFAYVCRKSEVGRGS